ncbi:DUF4239 domain-containing protein [Granulicella sp. L60]|uniref:bestrophin-like domain n=1 Tax=Granulicella sp. L60 TaxID=1641866 RepID=UPI00131E96CA|nr:DUF4239 domain-containing protein [Granulicella sp. L60]
MSNWLLGTLIVGIFIIVGLAGLYLTRPLVRRLHLIDHSHNDIVGFYLAAVTVFYGITLGLVAVGTWETYSEVENKVDHEAIAVGALYRDISAYPDPVRSALQNDLRTYIRQVIDVGWPMQQRGIVPNNASGALSDFQRDFMSFEPNTERQKIIAAEAYRAFNDLTESRRARLNSVTDELPGPLWLVVVAGALLSIASTWFFHTASFKMHFWMTIIFSALIGLLIYLVASLDNPYRGRVSVSPEALERVYEQIMFPQPK